MKEKNQTTQVWVERRNKPFAVPAHAILAPMPGFYDAVYHLVRQIPRGRVMTYGQIATILGCPRAARAVGYAMRASGRMDDVPWQRVINARGRISARNDVERPMIQRILLKAEGIDFDATGACDLGQYRWEPPNPDDFFFEPSVKAPFGL